MISLLASLAMLPAVLSLAAAPDDLVELPMLEIGGLPSCDTERDCPSPDRPLCDTNTGECVACLGPEHCDEGWICGPTGDCLDACEVDGDCDGVGGQVVCNPESGTCVQCLGSEGCAEAEYCDTTGQCRDDHCIPGSTFCFGDTIMQCLRDGGSTMEVETCEGGCAESEGVAECVVPTGSSGDPGSTSAAGDTTAASGGGTSPGDGSGPGTSAADGGTTPAEDDAGSKGCACRSDGRPSSSWTTAWAVVLLIAGARRRRPA